MESKSLDPNDSNLSTLTDNISQLFDNSSSYTQQTINFNGWDNTVISIPNFNFQKNTEEGNVPESGNKSLVIQYKVVELTDDMKTRNIFYDTYTVGYDILFFVLVNVHRSIGFGVNYAPILLWNFNGTDGERIGNVDISLNIKTFFSYTFTSEDTSTHYAQYITIGIV